ncbi:MAG TPA: c-type cytochrome [Candidatus Binatus sp.]|jgi:photosynthetic reaction center cytochrome c subunit|nr:c-type cytochrome [Candidatus Binatus sp.]
MKAGKQARRQLSGNTISLALGVAALFWVPVSLLAHARSSQQAAPAEQSSSLPRPAPPGIKTASEAFKNVQVLSDVPADQLIPSMRYITFALGVRCEYCHLEGHFDSDEKPAKKRARGMMKMMFAIDNTYFSGHRAVTCYTCHRGAAKAADMPVLADVASASRIPADNVAPPPLGEAPGPANSPALISATANPLPSVKEILEKYIQALGGEAAIIKTKTRVDKGILDVPARRMHSTVEIYRKTPDKIVSIVHTPRGDSSQGYNGSIGWQARGDEAEEVRGDDLVRLKDLATLNPGLNLQKNYARVEVSRITKINDHDSYCVNASRPTGASDQYYFETQSGLLLRVSTQIDSPLGAIPQDTSYQDYRDVSGVQTPFSIRVARPDGESIYKWEQIQANIPIDDSRFDKPAEKPKEEPKEPPATKH